MATKKLNIEGPEVAQAFDTQTQLVGAFGIRNANNLKYDDIFNMIWSFTGTLDGIDTILTTISPSIRNRVLGMRRLLDGTDALIKATTTDINFDKDKLERSMQRWLSQSSKITKKRIISEMALSALLYGEIQVGLNSTKSMVEMVKESRKDRAKEVAKQLPYMIGAWHPNEGRYLTDDYGLTVFSRETATNWGVVQGAYGAKLSPEQLLKKPSETCVLTRYWSLENFVVFVDGRPLFGETHDLGEIPVIVQLVDGSQLFEKTETQRQSVMYAVDKAGYYDQQNTILTLVASIVFAMGVAPMYKHTLPPGDENRKLNIDYNVPGAPIHLLPGETYEPIDNRGLIDPALRELYTNNERAIEESTIYNTALGAPVEANIAFSTVSLLAQQGRLPLSGPQRAIGDAISALLELGMRVMKSSKSSFMSNGIDLQPSTMPEDIQIDVNIDIKLPQDKLQLANIAHLLKNDGLTDLEWIQTNILNITDTTTMSRNIIRDKLYAQLGEAKIASLIQEWVASVANVPAAGGINTSNLPVPPTEPPPGIPGQEAPMGGDGQAGVPTELGMNATAAPETGLTGIPSAQAGVLPSQGRGVVPMPGA